MTFFPAQAISKSSSFRTRVVIAGLGTVGGGVLSELRKSDAYDIVGCAVRDKARHAETTDRALLCSDPVALLGSDPGIVIELLGGEEPAGELIRGALAQGRDVVTANKALIARQGSVLRSLARRHKRTLAYSAAVGGAVPVLETIDAIVKNEPIEFVRGALSGTATFILGALARGTLFADALRAAQKQGLTEADPRRDIDGIDVAEKLAIVAAHAFGRDIAVGEVRCQGIDSVTPGEPKRTLVATVASHRGRVRCEVAPIALAQGDVLAGLEGAENRVHIRTKSGRDVVIGGLGAGRAPTTQSILSDLNSIEKGRAS